MGESQISRGEEWGREIMGVYFQLLIFLVFFASRVHEIARFAAFDFQVSLDA